MVSSHRAPVRGDGIPVAAGSTVVPLVALVTLASSGRIRADLPFLFSCTKSHGGLDARP